MFNHIHTSCTLIEQVDSKLVNYLGAMLGGVGPLDLGEVCEQHPRR